MENKPFAFTIVDNLYRVIPLFNQKLSEKNENFHQTNVFLETLSNSFRGLCLLNLFMALKDLSRLEMITDMIISLIVFLPIIAFSSLLISVNESDLPSNLLSYLLDFTKNNWQCEERKRIINDILGLLKIFSKKLTLVPILIRYEWPNACIQWLKTNGTRPSSETDFLICLILQKLARHTAGVQVLNALNCLEVLDGSKEQMKKDHNEHDYGSIHFIQCITSALLVEADEIEQKAMLSRGEMCQVLEQIVSFIIRASHQPSRLESFVYKGCHIAEILSVLSQLFLNDDILTKCLRENNRLFDGLSQLLIHFAEISKTTQIYQVLNDETLILLTNLLWSLSFHQCNHEKFKSNTVLMSTLSNLATSSSLYVSAQIKSLPRDLSPVKKVAEGILWNLKASHTVQPKGKSGQHPLIMISYCHSDSTFCHELVEHLSHHIPVWVDYKQAHHSVHHSDDLWEEIAHAMEMAAVIILIVSNDYYDSKSCRHELCYVSDTLKKRFVPIYASHQQYKASGWLGIRIAGQKYVHFGKKDFTDAVTELESLLVTDHKVIKTPKQSPYETSQTKKNDQENPLKTWTSKDIQKWFDDNHIHSDLITLFADQFHTGTALLVYARHLKLFYRNEYAQILTNYYKTFNGKRLQTVNFVTFVDAFWRLRDAYDAQSKNEDAREKYNENQFPYPTKILNEGMTWL